MLSVEEWTISSERWLAREDKGWLKGGITGSAGTMVCVDHSSFEERARLRSGIPVCRDHNDTLF